MTDCDQCQEMGKVEHVSNSYSYYAQAIGIFLLVLSVVGGLFLFLSFCLFVCQLELCVNLNVSQVLLATV